MFYKDDDIRKILKENKNGIVGYVWTASKENSIISIEQQKNIIIKYCNKYNIKVNHFFIDAGYSGLSYNRPRFQEVINSNKYKVVIVSDISKIGRNIAEGIKIIQKKHKILIAINNWIVIENLR